MDKQIYKPRIIDQQVEEYLSAFGAVCVEGPKWCGKTWTSAYHSKSEIYIGDPAGNFQNRQLAELSPALVLEGETPRLIDEWQEVPPLWDAVRYKVDQTAQKGQFILTGSAKEKPEVAEVIAVGPGGMVDGKEVVMTVKVGDKVITSKYSGTQVKVEGEEYTIVRQGDILAIVE